MKISSIFDDSGGSYERSYDFGGMVRNVLESYPNGIAHGLQKDAIQNGWDAMKLSGKNPTKNFVENNWSFRFVLSRDKQSEYTLQMIDAGTTGLVGDLRGSNIEEDNVDSLGEGERWAKFESWGIQGAGGDSLGSRGQGKLLFVAASKDQTISYDSLRGDGGYRFGATELRRTSFPIRSWDESEAREKIKSLCNLEPLAENGTRIIIHNLLPEIVDEIKSGAFLKAIEDTWWPNILKLGARILVEFDSHVYQAVAPELYQYLCSQKPCPVDTDSQKFWRQENLPFEVGRGKNKTQHQIKKVYLGYDTNLELPEIEQGVSCFRGGMKVDNSIRFAMHLRERTYGYVEFDDELDQALKNVELPSHYGFRSDPIWRQAKKEIESQIASFESESLGADADPREKQRKAQTEDEKAALTFINDLVKDWSLSRRPGGGKGPVDPPPGPPKPSKPIHIYLRDFNFPSTANRLDYGESINDFYVEIANDTAERFVAKVNVRVMKTKFITSLIGDNQESRYVLKPHDNIKTHALSLAITKEVFAEKGEYHLLVELTEHDTGVVKDTLTRKFWVEQEPPVRGSSLFDMRPINLKDDPRQWLLRRDERGGKNIVEYNTSHPSYQRANNQKSTKALRKKGQTPVERYLKEITLVAAIRMKLYEISVNDPEGPDHTKPFSPDFPSLDLDAQFKEIDEYIGYVRKILDEEIQ